METESDSPLDEDQNCIRVYIYSKKQSILVPFHYCTVLERLKPIRMYAVLLTVY